MDNDKLHGIELNDKDLEPVWGGGGGEITTNPRGLKEGDSVYFYYDIIDQWMWGYFKYYDNGVYRVRWNDTTIVYGKGVAYLPVEADETDVPEKYIK